MIVFVAIAAFLIGAAFVYGYCLGATEHIELVVEECPYD